MQILGECPKCKGSIVKNSLGDTACLQCGTIFDYSSADLKENRRLNIAMPGKQGIVPKKGSDS